ncbi:BTAD domain-containing putative transcriptional regulator [Geodermatophilus sp. CPCC 205506]|uniref:BTAD domain-containing putative transcriptional regulator n=1 Tax=Geodermatophilus sp. CPCC 205506 TaxID=2936596 RepID=UPI003EEEC292
MLTVAVLGAVEVRIDGVPAAVPGGRTTELLVRLALDAGRPVRAERLLEDLWPDETGARRNTLQAKVSQLRRALGDPAALTGGPAGYTLAVDPRCVDAVRAVEAADRGAALLASGDAAGAAAACRAGLELFGSEVLPAAGPAAWVLPHRVRLEETRLRLVEDGFAARLASGAATELVGELESHVAAQPLRERSWALLITALYRAGRQGDALAAARRVTRLLAEELGVDPGAELAAVTRQVLAHDPALDRPTAPVRAPRRGNVPALSAPLVGRADDLSALQASLRTHRLVTLVGPAGVGKTRLATEAARLDDAPDGAWLVRLEGVRGAAELPAALGDVLPGTDAAGDVVGGLRGADLLLVLDNCEHLADAVAGLVAQVLDAAPRIRVLATSQRPLGIDGELLRTVPPLPEEDAVALFAQRAAERRPGFVLTDETAPAVAQLCSSLDCLPLAIELAAARARILTVAEMSRRLDDRFTLLADPTSSRPARRRTLAAALAWSYDLLFPDDQRGLWALAQFPGGATLPAVEHVLAALGVPAGAGLDVVERLVDRSLLDADPGGPETTRFRLLDSVRAFAADRAAEAGAADVAADAVVAWVAGVAGVVAAQVRGPGQAAAVAVTAAERATIDAALDRARAADPETGLRIAVGFGWAWVLLDDAAAAARLRAAREAADGAPLDLRVTALLLESWLEAMSGDLRRARTTLDAALLLAGDDGPLADLTRWYGAFVLTQEGRAAEALAALERCRGAFAASGADWYAGGALLLAAYAHLALGDTGAGRAACEESIAVLGPLGDAWALLHAEAALGRVAQAEHRFADAARHHGNAAEAAGRLGFAGAAALHLSHLARAQHEAGDPGAASTMRRALAGAEQAGDLRLLAETRVALAEIVLAAGDRAAARDLLEAATRWYAASGAGEGAALAARLVGTLRQEEDEEAGAAPR